jgi:hypothetical protein
MKSDEIKQQIFWFLRWCFIVSLVQFVVSYSISYLLGQYVWTDDQIMAMTASSGPFSAALNRLGEFEQKFFLFARTPQGVGVLIVFLYFYILKARNVPSAYWVNVVLCFAGALGLAYLSGWNYIVTVLAECVPACGWALHKFSDVPDVGGKDFHNMGGEYYRGNQLVRFDKTYKVFDKLSAKEGAGGIELFPGHTFVYRKETEGILAIGSPGSGKTQLIHHWAEEVYKRPKDRAIIWDNKGLFTQSFMGRPGVDLLAAWDKRSMIWLPGEDIKGYGDAQQMTDYLIPEKQYEPQDHFPNSARTIIKAIFCYLDAKGKPWGWSDVWKIINLGRKDLYTLLASFKDGQTAANLIIVEQGGRASAGDVYSTLLSKTEKTIGCFAKAWPQGGRSLRNWIHSDSKFLILGGIPAHSAIADATANIVLPLIINELLSGEDESGQRTWLFLDEMSSLGKIDDLIKATTTGRSKGLCVVAGIQDMGKIEHNFGLGLASSLSNSFGTKIVLRCSDPKTSEWASRALGDQDIFEKQVSTGTSSEGLFSSKTIRTTSEQKVLRTRAVFNSTEIANLENLSGVLHVSSWPLIMFKWVLQTIPKNAKSIEPAAWLSQKSSLNDDPNDTGLIKPWEVGP